MSEPLATGGYLDVRYSAEKRPYTSYPAQLCRYLTETYLSEHRQGALLDVGSGRGEFLHEFALEGFSGSGVDREQPRDARFPEPVRVCDLEQDALPFDSASFDVVFNKSVLEHTRNVTHLLRECHRVLRPGGTLLSLVPDFNAQWYHFYDDWTHVRPFTLTGLRECLLCHDFVVEEARYFRQLPILWRHPYLRPLADVSALAPSALKRFKWVRFSKEWMLLAVAKKPEAVTGPGRSGKE